MRAEEKEIEKLIYGSTEVDETAVDDNPTEVAIINDDDFDDEVMGSQPLPNEPPEPASTAKQRTSWKKRYASYKASTDQTIFELRQSVANFQSDVATLRETNAALTEDVMNLKSEASAKVDQFEGVITPEEEDLIGTEAVDIIKKFASRKQDTSKYDDLLAKIAAMEQEKTDKLKSDSENFQKDTMVELKAKLTNLMPDWSEIDVDPEFATYMKEPDNTSGLPRTTHYNQAVGSRDVERVLSFYKQFKSLKPRSKQEILAGKVTPVGGGSSQGSERTDNPQKIYSINEYSDFMDSVARGDYRGSKELRLQAKKLERQYDKALMEGRVR